ncbi:MAG: carbohydrate ABC transporter permease [Gaiellaceae bacterium]
MTATPSPQTPLTAPPVAIPPAPPLAGEGGRRRLPRGGPIRVAVLGVLLTGVSLLFMYPFLWAISASLKPRNDVFDNRLIPKHFHPWNYVEVFKGVPGIAQGAPFGLWFWNSIWIGVAAAAAVTVSSALVAFAFAYFRFPLRNFLFGCVLGSMMLPGAVTMIPTYLVWNKIHLTGTQYPLWAGNLFASAFYIFLMRQFFLGIPRELFEAARVDGDNYFSMFWRIAVPLAKPALIVTAVFEFKASWTDLMKPLIYLRDDSQFTVPRGLYALLGIYGPSGGGHGDYQVIIAATVIATIPMIIIFFLGQRYFIEGIATSGRKG